jgi:hypothetical protein
LEYSKIFDDLSNEKYSNSVADTQFALHQLAEKFSGSKTEKD